MFGENLPNGAARNRYSGMFTVALAPGRRAGAENFRVDQKARSVLQAVGPEIAAPFKINT
jgi:hypothetical protein